MATCNTNNDDRKPAAVLTTFGRVPPFAVGFVRDLRVRWALEEAGRPYRVRLIGADDRDTAAYRQQQPFGQVPVYEEDGLHLFESGAILLLIGKRSQALMPPDEDGRARTAAWAFAALNSIEPHIQNLAELDLFHQGEEWAALRRPALAERVSKRLAELNQWLTNRDYLVERFTVADILMTTVLRELTHTDMVARHPALQAYQHRCTARPAFAKALADQTALYAPEAAKQQA